MKSFENIYWTRKIIKTNACSDCTITYFHFHKKKKMFKCDDECKFQCIFIPMLFTFESFKGGVNLQFYCRNLPSFINPLPHLPILGSSNSAANKDRMS